MPRDPYAVADDPIDTYDTGDRLKGIGGGAASGAAAGAAAGPYGALIGAGIGGVVGAFTTQEQEDAYRQQQQQQHDLQHDLQSHDQYDRMLQNSGLGSALQRQEAVLSARESAARGGLTPAATASLEQRALADANFQFGAERPALYLAAQQIDLARRNQVIQEYQASQGLADNAQPQDYSQALGAATSAVSQLATVKSAPASPAAPTTPSLDASIAPVSAPQIGGSVWDSIMAEGQGGVPTAAAATAPGIPAGAIGAAQTGSGNAVSATGNAAPAAIQPTPVAYAPPQVGPGAGPTSPGAGAPGTPPPGVHPETYAAAQKGDAEYLLAYNARNDPYSSTSDLDELAINNYFTGS